MVTNCSNVSTGRQAQDRKKIIRILFNTCSEKVVKMSRKEYFQWRYQQTPCKFTEKSFDQFFTRVFQIFSEQLKLITFHLKTYENIVRSYHVTYAFHSEPTLYSWLNVKQLRARNRSDIWSLSNCNGARIHKH